MKRLAIITTHPIQYNAPLFQLLTARKNIEIKVFYTWGESVLNEKYDPGFGKVIDWDIPLLNGYAYEFLENTASDKGSHHFKGIINPEIIPAIIKYNPDAVLVYGWSFQSHLKVMRSFKKKIPVLFRGDSTLLDEAGFFQSLKRNIFLRWIYSFVDIALYVGTNNYNYFKKAGLKEKQLIFAPHAIDNKRFECSSTACKKEAKTFRNKLNISSKAFVFLFAGKLEAKKNVGLLLHAFVKSKFEDTVHLVIIGNGHLENELKSGHKTENIHFVDFQNQMLMPAIYEMADVYILPSKGPGETWGLSVNEAMANGKVIIISNKCGCAVDLIKEGGNGYIFPSNNLSQLSNKLSIAYSNHGNLKSMGQVSKNKISSFSFENIASQIENTLNNL